MVELNLLHTRKEQLSYENRILRRYLVSSLCAAFIILICCHGWLQLLNQHEQEAVDHLKETMSVPVMPVSQNSGSANDFSAADVLTLLFKAAETNKNGICYVQIARDSSQFNLQGNAWTIAGIANLVKQMSLAGLFADLHLLSVKQQRQGDVSQFNIAAREA